MDLERLSTADLLGFQDAIRMAKALGATPVPDAVLAWEMTWPNGEQTNHEELLDLDRLLDLMARQRMLPRLHAHLSAVGVIYTATIEKGPDRTARTPVGALWLAMLQAGRTLYPR
jgi:hypothetical protein